MINTKKIKEGTILTIKWETGEVDRFVYYLGHFSNPNSKIINVLTQNNMYYIQDIVNLLNNNLVINNKQNGVILQYGIQDPNFKY